MPLSSRCQWNDCPSFRPVVGLDLLDLERQFRERVVDELDCGLLVVLRVCAKHPHPGAVVDGCVLVVALLFAGLAERFDALHIDLQRVPWALFLVSFPFGVFAFVALRGRQPAQDHLVQDSPYSRGADGDVVVALEIHRDLLRPEMVVLAQPEDLLHDLNVGRGR